MTSTISIVSPMFNEEETADKFLEVLFGQCDELAIEAFEVVIVDDGSADHTHQILKRWSAQRPELRVIRLSRNFGHQAAITAGIAAANGDCVVVMDSDLQDPPSVIPLMLERWRSGVDVVYAVRRKRDGDTWLKKRLAHAFYRVLGRLSDTPIPTDTGDFRLMSRNVVNTLNAMPERDRYIRGMVSWVGFTQEPLEFDRAGRHAGEPKYSLGKSMRLAMAGIVGFSDKPLFVTMWVGMWAMVLAVLGLLWIGLSAIFGWGEQLRGWTSLAVIVLFFSAVQLIFLGIVGLYISRIFQESKHRPIYVIGSDTGPVLGSDAH